MKQIFSILLVTVMISCSLSKHKTTEQKSDNLYLIETSYGNITIKLYDETPLHRDNFKKLVADSFYDGLLFHRIIPGFMIQGGDPESKTAKKGAALGSGTPGYTIPAEILDTFIHKKGALAAARLGDNMNPERRSSGSQFYIVQGSEVKSNMLDQMEQRINQLQQQNIANKVFNDSNNLSLRNGFLKARSEANRDSMQFYGMQLDQLVKQEAQKSVFQYTPLQRQLYDSLGGAPSLDNQYTVFGEVVEGLNVVDSIIAVRRDARDRPVEDVKMTIKKL